MAKITPENVINALHKEPTLTFNQLCKALYVRGKQKDALKRLLKRMLKSNAIQRNRNKQYMIGESGPPDTLIGRIEIHEKGFGFVVPESELDNDVFISQRNTKGAAHLDKVRVEISSMQSGSKREGRVIEIIEEEDQEWLGVVFSYEDEWLFCPWGRRTTYPVSKADLQSFTFDDDDIVLARLISGKNKQKHFEINKSLGNIMDPQIDSDILIHEYQLDVDFSKTAIKEANEPTEKDPCAHLRKDLRDLPFITIDGEDAKDFDDAVYMDENQHLWVAIADVSLYVAPNSKLDIEACDRGNSFYFPDRVVPMLPEVLSNGLCSLRPFETKMTMVVEISFDKNGDPKLEQVTPALIESKARLTYTQVHERLLLKDPPKEIYGDSLARLAKLSKKRFEKRMDDGGIDFDMPEFSYFQDLVTPIQKPRTLAHRLIEECMLAANQVTSEFVDKHGYPNIYRVHEPPDPLKMQETIDALHLIFDKKDYWQLPQNGHDIQEILEEIDDHPFVTQIQYLFLRAMSQARYDTQHLGHYGLGFEYYSHFTSPIRRYADLVFHRIIKRILLEQDMRKPLFPKNFQTLSNICVHVSKQDRKSITIEREMKKIKGIRYMMQNGDKWFEGVVSGVIGKGVFVEMLNLGIEGLIEDMELRKHGYKYYEDSQAFVKKGTNIRFGTKVHIKVKETNLFRRQLNFHFKEE